MNCTECKKGFAFAAKKIASCRVEVQNLRVHYIIIYLSINYIIIQYIYYYKSKHRANILQAHIQCNTSSRELAQRDRVTKKRV